MKPSVLFASLLVASSATWMGASANPKGMGRSAIEAARLKHNPPANYLAHYLPDDRYKIAGNVWKFVSTDLDTYYHVPQSPNMMRQPASNVIGFANARDAEEAGYVADPTDGTADRVAVATQALGVNPQMEGQGRTPQEQLYVGQVTALLNQSQRGAQEFAAKMARVPRPQGNTPIGFMPPEVRQAINQQLSQRRAIGRQLSALRPPARYKKFHSLLSTVFQLGTASATALNRMLSTGDLSQIGQMQERAVNAGPIVKQLLQQANSLGINPALLK